MLPAMVATSVNFTFTSRGARFEMDGTLDSSNGSNRRDFSSFGSDGLVTTSDGKANW